MEWGEEEEEDDTEQVRIFLNKKNLYHFVNDSSPCYRSVIPVLQHSLFRAAVTLRYKLTL